MSYLFTSGGADARSLNPIAGILQANHQQIIGSDGRPVRFRGLNIGGWLFLEGWMLGGHGEAGETAIRTRLRSAIGTVRADRFWSDYLTLFFNETDMDEISAQGFNLVRVPVNWHSFVNASRCQRCIPPGFIYLDRIIRWAEARRIYVIIDMHSVPGGQADVASADPPTGGATFWKDVSDQDQLVAIWRRVAERYRRSKTVAGYDLINEPMAPAPANLCDVYARLISSIRAVDRDHIIWLEGSDYASSLEGFDYPLGANTALSTHMYTNYGDHRTEQLDQAAAAAKRLDVPVWVGEFGLSSYGSTRSSVRKMAAAAAIVGWSYWAWKRSEGYAPAMCVLRLPRQWLQIADWLTGQTSVPQPSGRAIQQGMRRLLTYLQRHRCIPDRRLSQALMNVSR